jgi:hypothetical protein
MAMLVAGGPKASSGQQFGAFDARAPHPFDIQSGDRRSRLFNAISMTC